MSLTDTLLGRPLASSEEGEQKIGVFAGVPSLGLDALGSAAYGPEAALTILLPLGVLGLAYVGPITLVILGLLAILYFSYRQTIAAYPNGGGSYTVARENLGVRFGLLAAAALMLDYTLNVAVGISAGVGVLISAVPGLHRHTLALCLGFPALITAVNLRGAREAGLVFALPTYLFVGSLALLGRRLVYTVGIVFLTGLAGLLLIVFGGITDRLIPLFAVGAFPAFTLSQAGMVMHWRKEGGAKSKGALVINAVGAGTTVVALTVILVAKFSEGAWITLLILPALLAVFGGVRHHYHRVAREVGRPCALDLSHNEPPVVIVPLGEWNVVSERALRFGMRLSPDVYGVYVRLPDANGKDEEGSARRRRCGGSGPSRWKPPPRRQTCPRRTWRSCRRPTQSHRAAHGISGDPQAPLPGPAAGRDHPGTRGNALVGVAAAQPPRDRPEGEPVAGGRPVSGRHQRPLANVPWHLGWGVGRARAV